MQPRDKYARCASTTILKTSAGVLTCVTCREPYFKKRVFLLYYTAFLFLSLLLPRVSIAWHRHRKPRPISAKKRNKFWTKSCSQIFTTEESVHQAPTEQVFKSQLVIALCVCVSLPPSPSLPFSSWHRKLIDRLRV